LLTIKKKSACTKKHTRDSALRTIGDNPVTTTLAGFDRSLYHAAVGMGASPTRAFWDITMPLIRPSVISGGLFAFVTSFDEVVVVLFLAGPEQRTIPRQMFSGLREQINPTILAVATLLILISVALIVTLELLRRRSVRIRGEAF
jgi:putative spermidine/putrescine transport system permease protein